MKRLSVIVILALCITMFFCACTGSSQSNYGYFIIDGTIRSYQNTEKGLILGIEFEESMYQHTDGLRADFAASGIAWPPEDLIYFLLKPEQTVNPTWLWERIKASECDLEVNVMSEFKDNNTFVIQHLTSRTYSESKDMTDLYNLLARSNCTKIEYKNEESTESILIFSDGDAVKNLCYNAGLVPSDAPTITDDWQYRITYYQNYVNETHTGDQKTVCLINPNGICINGQMYDVKLKDGMEGLYNYWAEIYANYYSIYVNK